MPLPPMVPVQSSYLAEIGHDGDAMFIRFKPSKQDPAGPVFRYPTATRDHHDELLAAESPGKHFLSRIKGVHDAERFGG